MKNLRVVAVTSTSGRVYEFLWLLVRLPVGGKEWYAYFFVICSKIDTGFKV